MFNICDRCQQKQKSLFKIVVAPKTYADLCADCYNKWFDQRDKLVVEAFQDFVKENKKK